MWTQIQTQWMPKCVFDAVVQCWENKLDVVHVANAKTEWMLKWSYLLILESHLSPADSYHLFWLYTWCKHSFCEIPLLCLQQLYPSFWKLALVQIPRGWSNWFQAGLRKYFLGFMLSGNKSCLFVCLLVYLFIYLKRMMLLAHSRQVLKYLFTERKKKVPVLKKLKIQLEKTKTNLFDIIKLNYKTKTNNNRI